MDESHAALDTFSKEMDAQAMHRPCHYLEDTLGQDQGEVKRFLPKCKTSKAMRYGCALCASDIYYGREVLRV